MDRVTGAARSFPIFGQTLTVPESMDVFNSYRLIFQNIAFKLCDAAEGAYHANIRDLDSFLEHFIKIYDCMLNPVVKEAFNILIAEGVWTVNYEAFLEQHVADFHLAIDDYNAVIDRFNAAIEENQRKVSNMMGYVPNLTGGGFGLTGALKGIAKATAFNLVRDGIEASVLRNADVKPVQRVELYRQINPDVLLDHVFIDYWHVFLSLVWALIQNGQAIWWPTSQAYQQANNIFHNLTHPNFPQDRILAALLDVIRTDPYDAEYYKFMLSRFGYTDEVVAIKNYFGYNNL